MRKRNTNIIRGRSKVRKGRPLIDSEGLQLQERTNVNLNQTLKDKAELIGGGNVSAGIRKALKDY